MERPVFGNLIPGERLEELPAWQRGLAAMDDAADDDAFGFELQTLLQEVARGGRIGCGGLAAAGSAPGRRSGRRTQGRRER